MRVVFHYDCGDWLAERLAQLKAHGIEVLPCPEADDVRFAELIAGADVLWHVLKPVTASHIASAPNLRLIQKIGVGVNTIDLEAAEANDIAVCNMPGTNARAVAEMTLGLMLSVSRRLPLFDRWTRYGKGWGWPAELQGNLGEIAGKTIVFAGFGDVARTLAPVLLAMGAKIIYTATEKKDDVAYPFKEKQELLREADILSLHMPLTDETNQWLDRDALGQMKPGAIVINTARGELVDEAALAAALNMGHISGAGLDVFSREPVDAENPLVHLENVVTTPHVAWITTGTLARSLAVAADNCRRLGAGEELMHRVV